MEKFGGGKSQQSSSKKKIEPTKDAKQLDPSESQRCSDTAWRRLDTRHSAPRRPHKFQNRFYTRVAIAKDDVFTVKSVRVVTCRQRYPDQTRC